MEFKIPSAAFLFGPGLLAREKRHTMEPNRTAILAEVDQILHRPTLTKEESARAQTLLALADSLVDRTELRRAVTAQHARELGLPAPFISTPDRKFEAYLREGRDALDPADRAKITSE